MPSVHFVALLMGVMWGAAPSSLAQDRRPTISYISQPEIVTDIGGTIEMRCNVQYASQYPVIWMKLDPVDRNNDLPITTGTTLILTDPVCCSFIRLISSYFYTESLVPMIESGGGEMRWSYWQSQPFLTITTFLNNPNLVQMNQ